jgi:hypothetical protein
MSDAQILRDDDRRLNLEQQKTRAKELRRAIAQAEPDALRRLMAHHPDARSVGAVNLPQRLSRLSDAQLVIARELGLSSWPQLKAHIEKLARARTAIADGAPAPDAGLATVHIRCGSDIRERLKEAGFAGDFLEVGDPVCQGPVPRDGDFIAVRARFLSDSYGVSYADAQARLTRERDGLREAFGKYQRIVLWFEHDSTDQLCLARVLAEAAAQRHLPVMELICIDRFPVITRFIGLGHLSPAALRSLWDERRRVAPALRKLGAAVWDALRDPSPMALHAIAAGGTPELPVMAPALRRHLQELPWNGDGLSLTQRLALEALRAGSRTVSALFRATQLESEPLPFLGDLMFWAVLRDMQRVADPPFAVANEEADWPKQILSLTPAGQALLAGGSDWLAAQPPVRWVGGVRITPGGSGWRWSGADGRPVQA